MLDTTKKQKQLLLANGFLAGLAELGVAELDASNIAFEGPFLHAWRRWPPSRNSQILPKVDFGSTDQPRNILFRVENSMSPFKNFQLEGITPTPRSFTPRAYLEVQCNELPVEDWILLARLFLDAQEFYRQD